MRSLRRVARGRPSDIPEVARALLLAAEVERRVRRQPLPDVAARFGVDLLGSPTDVTRTEAFTLPPWALRRMKIAQMVMKRWPLGDTCLKRSLVIGSRLRDLSPTLVIGVRPTTERALDAHAWLRIGGTDFDPAAELYDEFARS